MSGHGPVPTLDAFRLDGKVALITGASSGLGNRFARVLDVAGASVALVARREERLRALSQELRDSHPVAADLGNAAVASDLVESVLERFGRLDVLVNNAGISAVVPAEQESLASFADVLELNLTSAFALAQAARNAMDGEGSIVNIASMFGVVGSGQIPQASYSASKGGLISLTRELAAQWSRDGVRVNALCPGFFPSEMTADMMDDAKALRWLRSRMPMGRPGDPTELDGPLLFLASSASSYVTGQQIVVDGGWTIV